MERPFFVEERGSAAALSVQVLDVPSTRLLGDSMEPRRRCHSAYWRRHTEMEPSTSPTNTMVPFSSSITVKVLNQQAEVPTVSTLYSTTVPPPAAACAIDSMDWMDRATGPSFLFRARLAPFSSLLSPSSDCFDDFTQAPALSDATVALGSVSSSVSGVLYNSISEMKLSSWPVATRMELRSP